MLQIVFWWKYFGKIFVCKYRWTVQNIFIHFCLAALILYQFFLFIVQIQAVWSTSIAVIVSISDVILQTFLICFRYQSTRSKSVPVHAVEYR